ncbi:hypothetical protein MA9V1_244 [Chryseobacterium phage MA9V-1]|nr:hypothetical protein MA9V1_244 [Chryseobacterium phage MA9V-1]
MDSKTNDKSNWTVPGASVDYLKIVASSNVQDSTKHILHQTNIDFKVVRQTKPAESIYELRIKQPLFIGSIEACLAFVNASHSGILVRSAENSIID